MAALQSVDLAVCPCAPAALQLLWMGYFPCAPLGPTLAVSLQLLSFVQQFFMCIPPSTSAWCESLEAYLAAMGYEVDTKEGIFQRFSNAYHWYCILETSLDEYVQQQLQESASPPSNIPSAIPLPSSPDNDHCPLCFGGQSWQSNNSEHGFSDVDAIVCIDPCFTQKRRSRHLDDPVNPTATVFLSQEDICAMEHEVNELRKSKSSTQRRSGQALKKNYLGDGEDEFEEGMRITMSVLKGCNESFTAADTGIMALLCHHDHVIYLANMTSAGERQHYALALIKSLFGHLPDNFHIGLLYDIGCQLEQSCRKWGFPKSFLPCISFAISVFHAFDHQWAYQLIYHPQKCEGFGLSDGEGCEHFWSSIKGLIPSLHVSGSHQHLFVIDFQVCHLDMKSLTGLGQWLLHHWNHCQGKKAAANRSLRRCGVDIPTLQAEWVAQVSAQTKPAPCHSSKAAENMILQIMATQKSLANYEAKLEVLEKDLLHGVADMTSLNIQIAECHQKVKCFKEASQNQRATLGINGHSNLASIQRSAYLQLHMHALAIKKCIRDHLHQQKFELERLECSYWQTLSEQRLQNHTEASLASSYNNLCLQIVGLIHKGKAPQGSIAPLLIPRDSLFKLDGIGLGNDSDGLLPPWLADEKVHSGIRSLLELRHCEEEERHLLQERRALTEWFSEEWGHVQKTRQSADVDLAYELDCRALRLAGLCILWKRQLRGYPGTPNENWGASDEELHSMVQGGHVIYIDSDNEERFDGLESEGEEDEDEVMDDELLCVAEEFSLADEYHQQSDMPLEEF
ncbi:hypothetical protein F5J12DRAFT_907337 [Pisolithus orientalis]|uniref:uncharacterized protein n=1 Tax=Pisolithus orientalis TaxID=936130 RepID=UPI0022245343|nr:uncharacterized protein F5J12DRAFT_907337 [Pisolithus orientalis]KAI5993753.1 hypothetical protein F5J12DRAFT_907337 [Pisolithus orientalis]